MNPRQFRSTWIAAVLMTFACLGADPIAVAGKAGYTVTWTNFDNEPHTVVSDKDLFRSGALDTNEGFTFKFDKARTYRFNCSIHPQMVGTIVVQ